MDVGFMHRPDPAPSPEELDGQRRQAWGYYRAVLRGRGGQDYEETERAAWHELQAELAEIERRERLSG
jgi:hypothetical protein